MFGFVGLVLASIVSEVTVLLYATGLMKKQDKLKRYADLGVMAACGLMTLVSMYLLGLLITHDFQNIYVAQHTSRDLPLVFVLSAFWAGQEGSLLFWGWLISIFASHKTIDDKK